LLPFEVARKIIQSLKISGYKEYHELKKQGKLPDRVPEILMKYTKIKDGLTGMISWDILVEM
jgi:hypothetical protein